MGGTPINTGFELKLDDGSVIKTDTIEEAVKVVAKMKSDTAMALREERQKREEMEGQINQLRTEVAQRNAPPSREDNGFNKDHYYRLVGEDPLAAQNYLDAYRFQIPDPSQVPAYFQGAFQKVTNLEQSTLAANFVNTHPDFPGGTKEAEILTKEVMRLQESGHPVNMGTLELAWRNVVDSEQIKPIEAPQEQEEPNPSLAGGGSGTLDAESARVEEEVTSGRMSTADLEKYLRSKGAFG
jgi:hypothetical protein